MKSLLEAIDIKYKQKSFPKDLKKILTMDPIGEFVQTHPHIKEQDYQRSYLHLKQVIQEKDNCNKCYSLSACPNVIKGHYHELQEAYDYLDFRVIACVKHKNAITDKDRKSLIKSHYIPKSVTESTFKSLDFDNSRAPIIEAAVDFCTQFSKNIPTKGLYIYGALGIGKSMIAGAIARNLIRYNIDSFMIYVPEFMREIKKSIGDNTVEIKITELKKATVLILDDIGAEAVTEWTRDEILGAILQYRTSEGLPTIYTSNLNLEELEDHLATSQKKGEQRMKATRIMERIKHFVVPFNLKGRNRRG